MDVNEKFDLILDKLSKVDKIDTVLEKLDNVEHRLDEHSKKLDKHSKQLKDINYRFDRLLFELKSDFNKIEDKFNEVD